jgi:L-histidine N-alpha-methyltransferase
MPSMHLMNHPRLEIRNYLTHRFEEEIAADIRAGMTAAQKYIPSKYFYDARGSRLFERICTLPEYYLTRTELGILGEIGPAIMRGGGYANLVELGSGANWKISLLIDACDGQEVPVMRYIPIDVSASALVAASDGLIRKYPDLSVLGIVADFTAGLHLLPDEGRRLILLFGSTIGNFDEAECHALLADIADSMRENDHFLIGLDMVKETAVLEAAYNDAQGVTAAFNKNILHVVNRTLGADFNPAYFDHLAVFDGRNDRIEMHLVAKAPLAVGIRDLDLAVELEEGETIRTEISRKFRKERCERMFEEAGLAVERWFSDPGGWFSLVELGRR